MNISEKRFVEQRAVQLAILILSRRRDLLISETHGAQEYGFDLLVNVTHDGQATGRMFGVEVKARTILQAVPVGDNNTYKINIPASPFPQDLPFPLCLFAFDMESDQGYYRWLLSPVIADGDGPKLLLNQESIFLKLSTETLDQIVQMVDAWYEKRAVLNLAY